MQETLLSDRFAVLVVTGKSGVMGSHFTWKSDANKSGSYVARPTTPPRISLLELDHVMTNRTEVGQVMDISSKLLDNPVTQTQRQTLENAFARGPLEIRIDLVLPKLRRGIRVRAKHRQAISAQSVDTGKVI